MKINNILKELNRKFKKNQFNERLSKALQNGKAKSLDDEFIAQFDGMYYGCLPIWYYFERHMRMGKCYDASAVLALAMGKESSVARGELSNLNPIYNERFGHGWVEVGNTVYDTTWMIICDKKTYYSIFGVKDEEVTPSEEFFDRCKELSDWTIYPKEYYEQNYYIMAYPTILQNWSIAKKDIESGDEKRIEKGKRLLEDLPDIDKVYEQYKKATKLDDVDLSKLC